MKNRKLFDITLLLLLFLSSPFLVSNTVHAADDTPAIENEFMELNGKKLPLVFFDRFDAGRDSWQTTDDQSWDLGSDNDGSYWFGLNKRRSNYKPTHRSPHNVALVRGLALSDCIITFRVKSTKDTGPHRDCCVFFGHQNPSQFYYVHLGAEPDKVSGQIMIVNDAPRVALTKNTKPVPWDNDWHTVKLTRDSDSGMIAVYFDDMTTPLISTSDQTFIKHGKIGLGSFDDMNDFTDVKVYGTRPGCEPESVSTAASAKSTEPQFEPRDNERIAFVGGSLAERMNLFGHLETSIHQLFTKKKLVVRNFGWPADEVAIQQRPSNYTTIDNPMNEFGPELFLCMFGANEHFAGTGNGKLEKFKADYKTWIENARGEYTAEDRPARFVLISPAAFERTENPLLPGGVENNAILGKYRDAIRELANELKLPFVDLLTPTMKQFNSEPGAQYTINGLHLNEAGDRFVAETIAANLFGSDASALDLDSSDAQKIRATVNDKSWFHLQDYRMLNGWYVYGGRRTWDKETFPGEYQKIRKMVSVRDQYIWDIAAGKPVPTAPDDSQTGDVFIPDTMFGTRGDNFRKNREPTSLEYPTPEDSIAQMEVPDGMKVQLFASEREFPELANPTQMAFDGKGRLWVSCMVNYPQWLPGSAKPGDKLLIFEDTNGDGKADVCKTFYDKLICPTGFEFHEDGVMVVDEPRILFLRDTDGDDKADEVTRLLDGVATDDTHHAMGAWEWSHGGLLYMLEGVSMSTTLETPWGPFRMQGPSGGYIFDPKSWKIRHFRTPGYGNPWCMVFDPWGMGIVGDGTGANQHWTSPLSGYAVNSRRTMRTLFDNEGMRPAIGSEFLYSRHLPDEIQGQFIYACVINMHGIPRFDVNDEPKGAGFKGQRIADLIDSTDKFFRPIDPQIGPDGAVWFGDWCNALIGHMQYSQRDPNRDHEHGRIFRLVNKAKPLIEPELQTGKSVEELLAQLLTYEPRTKYRSRRELRSRDKQQVMDAVNEWIKGDASPEQLCEAMWLQESFRELAPGLVSRIMQSDDFHARSAAVHSVANEIERFAGVEEIFTRAIEDEHPRVRLEGVRGFSFIRSADSIASVLRVLDKPVDYWITYTLEHTLHALKPFAKVAKKDGTFLKNSSDKAREYFKEYELASQPGGKAIRPLKIAQNEELPMKEKLAAVRELAGLRGGKPRSGKEVFSRVCSACHQLQGEGKEFGPALDGIGAKYNRRELIRHILWPNEEIAKGFETVQVLTLEGQVLNGFVLEENEENLSLGVATDDGKGKRVDLLKDDIDERKDLKASSMPEGLVNTIAPSEFLDLIQYLAGQLRSSKGWTATANSSSQDAIRKLKGFVEISRDAEIQIEDNFPAKWNGEVQYTLHPRNPRENDFAFHSPTSPPSKNPHVIVRLAKPAIVRAIAMENRTNKQFHKRAEGLAIWLSADGKKWNQAWKAEKPAAKYVAELSESEPVQFVKVGLDGDGIFHLNHITVYGDK